VRWDIPQLDDIRGQKSYLKALRPLLAQALSESAIAEFRHEWEGDLRPYPSITLPGMPYVQNEVLSDTHQIRLAAAHHLHFVPNGSTMEFKAGGVLWSGLPSDLVPALELLNDTRAVKFVELCARLNSDPQRAHLRQTISALARAGVVLVEDQ
jgi:hypothetical protein